MAPPIDASKVLIEELTLLIADISSVADEEARLAEAEEECKAQAKQAKQVAEQTAASQRQAGIEAMQKKVKRRSRELQDKIATLTDKPLEKTFNQFDLDGSETIDMRELKAACMASGLPMSDKHLQKAMKLLDKNGDGVLSLEEFKEISLLGTKLNFTEKMHGAKVQYALEYMAWITALRAIAHSGQTDVDWSPVPGGMTSLQKETNKVENAASKAAKRAPNKAASGLALPVW